MRDFFAATLLVVVVLGLTFGLTSLQAHRTADESIRHALVGRRRGVLARVTLKAMAHDPGDRYQSAGRCTTLWRRSGRAA